MRTWANIVWFATTFASFPGLASGPPANRSATVSSAQSRFTDCLTQVHTQHIISDMYHMQHNLYVWSSLKISENLIVTNQKFSHIQDNADASKINSTNLNFTIVIYLDLSKKTASQPHKMQYQKHSWWMITFCSVKPSALPFRSFKSCATDCNPSASLRNICIPPIKWPLRSDLGSLLNQIWLVKFPTVNVIHFETWSTPSSQPAWIQPNLLSWSNILQNKKLTHLIGGIIP